MLKVLEGARRRNDKGNAIENAGAPVLEASEETIAQAWEAVAAEEKRSKALNRWKQIQLDDFEADLARYVLLALIHMYRESQSNHTFPDGHALQSVTSPGSFGGATWRDFAALQSGELQQVGRFPELLQNHIRIYQVLKSRFSSAPPSQRDVAPARAADTPLRLSDTITINHVRVALGVDPGNAFGVWQVPATEDSEGLGFGVYPVPSFFNHREFGLRSPPCSLTHWLMGDNQAGLTETICRLFSKRPQGADRAAASLRDGEACGGGGRPLYQLRTPGRWDRTRGTQDTLAGRLVL